MRLVILKKTDISCYIFEIRQNTWTTSLVTRAFSIWCHFWISTLILTYTESTHFLLPVYICPIFSSSSLISRNSNANHLCSESESIICTQLNESHNIVLLKKHPSKNTFTMFSTTHKGWGWNIHGDSFLLQYFLSIFFSFSDIHGLESLKFYHIFMTLRYTEWCKVYFCLLRILQFHWCDRRKDYIYLRARWFFGSSWSHTGFAYSPIANSYLFCNLTGLFQHYCS